MSTIEATCPLCNATNSYGEELIGRYTLCQNCRCRFYVEVPTLEQSGQPTVVQGARKVAQPAPTTTLDDLLWDTQQGSQFIGRSLRRQERLLRQVLIALLAIGGLLAIQLAATLMR